MQKTRIAVFATCLMLSAMLGGCPVVPGFSNAEVGFSLSLDPTDIAQLDIEWRSGTLTVTIDDTATEITAVGQKKASAVTQAQAEAALDDIDITLATKADDATVAELIYDAPTVTSIVYGGDVDVTLPAGVVLNVQSANGDITITGNTGATTIQLANGDITVADQAGALTIDLANGAVAVTGLDGDLSAEVANGDIDIESQNGDVEIQLAAGDVAVVAQPADDGTVQIEVATGSVNLQLPSDFNAALSLQTGVAGTVDAALTGFDAVTDEVVQNRQVEATLNDGGGQVEVTVSVGSIDFAAISGN